VTGDLGKKMKKLVASLIVFGVLMTIAFVVLPPKSYSALVTPAPRVTPPSPWPDLICPEVSHIRSGETWLGITIGENTISDLEITLSGFGDYERIYPENDSATNSIQYLWNESDALGESRQAPFRIDVCVQEDVIFVMDVRWFFQPPIYVDDLVATYGIPDEVIWWLLENTRAVFWFNYGVMAEVFVQRGDDASFGRVTRVIYFIPQSSRGYETRWPFSTTYNQPFYPVDPSIPSEQNPFNFDSMIATITAEPSRTPTPTLRPPRPSATPSL
jgi:hypothetical protein